MNLGISSRELFQAFGIYGVANVLNSVVSFLLLPVLTRFLTPEDFGIVTMFLLTVSFLEPLVNVGLHGAVSRRFFDPNETDFGAYVSSTLLILLPTTLVLCGIVALLSGKVEEITHLPLAWALAAIFVAAANSLALVTLSILQVQQKPRLYSLFSVVRTLLNLGLSLWFVIGLGLHWRGRLEANLLAVFVFAFVSLWLLHRDRLLKNAFRWSSIVHALKFGLPLIPHAIGGLLIGMTDRLMISHLVGIAATGVYTVGYQIGSVIGILEDSFNRAWVPWLFAQLKENSPSNNVRIVRFTYLYIVAILGIALLWSGASYLFLPYFVAESFWPARDFIIWIAIANAFGGMYKMVTNYIFYAEKTRLLAMVTIFTGILNVGLSYLLISLNGLLGAAQAALLTFGLCFFLTWILAHKVFPMPWGEWRSDA